jgi:thiol-disulfide isomerase/thioredoxin
MIFRIYILLFFALLPTVLSAQTPTAKIFTATAAKVHALKSVSYRIQFTNENPFSSGDISKGMSKVEVLFDAKGTVRFKKEETNINAGQIIFREIYSKGKFHTFDLIDSIYTEDVLKNGMSSDLDELTSMMLTQLKEHPTKIVQKKDTLFENKSCYYFLFKAYDTIANGNHDYTFKKIVIDRETLLPVYFREDGAGSAFKEGLPLGRLHFFSEKRWLDVKVNVLINDTSFTSAGFHPPNKEMLAIGETAPPINVTNLIDDRINNDALKAPVRLVIFGATNCAANPLANPMLNRLQAKYASSAFAIVNIYSGETKEQINAYVTNNALKFPVFMGSSQLKHAFKTMGTPNFYLIDAQGKVVSSISGYSTKLENELTTQIEALLK